MSEKCNAPKNCDPFDEPISKVDSHLKLVEVWQEGKRIYAREGHLAITQASADMMVIRDSCGLKDVIYNKNAVIVVSYREQDLV